MVSLRRPQRPANIRHKASTNETTGDVTPLGLDTQGDIVSTFTAYVPGTYQLSVQVTLAPGVSPLTVMSPSPAARHKPAQ